MVAIRLRHPAGVATIQLPLDADDFTVQDLQQKIYDATDILPSRQNLKAGYPPKPLTLVSELPLTSLGLQAGEQIIVSEIADSVSAPAVPPSSSYGSNLSSVPAPTSPPSLPSGGPNFIETDGGVLVHRVVPDDNSCLFSAVALIFEQSISKAPEMRKIVADGIRNHPETYTEPILGMPPATYITTILKPSTWGGAIELGILASHYRTEIASIDVETGRVDRFSPPEGDAGGMRCILMYSGIHYDAATLTPVVEAPDEWHQTLFPVGPTDESDSVMVSAKKLADVLRAKRAFTNTSTFDIRCEDCGQGLKGEKDARAHAAQTGHVRFGEY